MKNIKKPIRSKHQLHVSRVLFGFLLILAVLIARVQWEPVAQDTSKVAANLHEQVLSYTSINIAALFDSTNSARSSNGLGNLSLNSQLNSSAQAKAQHMIDNDYWAHVAPDGTQPWYFFQQAGYSYQKAGENLAYGFIDSSSVVDAWMNSPSHRENVLGDYVDVGFGIADGTNYQGGQNTVVVAHYGKPYDAPAPTPAPTPTPTPAPAAPTTPQAATPAPTVQTTPAQTTPTTPTAPVETIPTPATSNPETPTTTNSSKTNNNSSKASTPSTPVKETNSQNITAWQNITLGHITPVIGISLGMTAVAGAAFAETHRTLMKHALLAGERFAVAHPALDIAAVAATVVVILSTTIARI
jgi:uncharacterized protein YkwD